MEVRLYSLLSCYSYNSIRIRDVLDERSNVRIVELNSAFTPLLSSPFNSHSLDPESRIVGRFIRLMRLIHGYLDRSITIRLNWDSALTTILPVSERLHQKSVLFV